MLKSIILTMIAFNIFYVVSAQNSFASNSVVSTINVQQKMSVTGSGSTYQKAFQDARSKMPAGKSWFKVISKKSGTTFYVTLYYKK